MEIKLAKDMFGRSRGENVSVSTDRAYHLMKSGGAVKDNGFMAMYERANLKPIEKKVEPKKVEPMKEEKKVDPVKPEPIKRETTESKKAKERSKAVKK